MTTHSARPGTAGATPSAHHGPVSGTTLFAAVLMLFGGVMAALEGIAAIARNSVFVVTRHYAFEFSLRGWGWVHLILGVALVAAGSALFLSGALWARYFGVFVASLGAIANFLWVPYYPLWATILIAVNILVVWALCTGMHKEAGPARTP
ncbi:hypothetical protein FNH09_31155 [Streptomyces adustus]|uniref:DUF7144 domain-containing protein n=1 Tax=Streptomyces adustus TaxID=1609272 RepID=A0A5N8VN54_9ACTN|nr:hypothetical protein [Streptomyces adustus]